MFRIYYTNFDFYDQNTFLTYEAAYNFAKKKGFEFEIRGRK